MDDSGLKRVFLSYGRADASELADKLAYDLRHHTLGQHERYEVWKDRAEIKSGLPWTNQIVEGLRNAAAMVALLSPHAVRTQGSDPTVTDSVCLDEIAYARFGAKKPIVPAMAVPCEPPFEIFRLDHVDFTGWTEAAKYPAALERLLDGLRAALSGQPRYRKWDGRLQPLDFDVFLGAKRRDFTGRVWLFDRIQAWLDTNVAQAALLVVGDPGIGKSALVAELVHRNFNGRVLAYHCCQANVPVTLSAGRFVRSVAAMIASRHPPYEQLIEQSPYQEALSESSCNRDPHSGFEIGILGALNVAGPPAGTSDERRLLMIDALDEGLTVARENAVSIVDLLVGRLDRFPSWLRIMATCRPEVVPLLASLNPEFLKADDPQNVDDLNAYIKDRLAREPLASKVATSGIVPARLMATLGTAAAGNFLYAQQALDGVHDGKLTFAELGQLPSGLSEQYEWFFKRQFGPGSEWPAIKPIFEVLVAAREPIGEHEIAVATGLGVDTDLPPALDAIASYLRVTDDAPVTREIFHRSLIEWLTARARTHRLHVIDGHRKLADGLWSDYSTNRLALPPYLQRNFADHVAEAAAQAKPRERIVLQSRLAAFVLDPLVQQQCAVNPFGMNSSLAIALSTVARGPARESAAVLLEVARGWELFRRDRLEPKRLFELARAGLLTPSDRGEPFDCDVETEIQLYSVDQPWTAAAKLMAAWLARDVRPQSADAMRRSARTGTALDERVDAEFEHRAAAFQPIAQSVGEQRVAEVFRIAGEHDRYEEVVNPSMLYEGNQPPPGSPDAEGTRYLAEFDTPDLVAFAQEHDAAGTVRVRDYIALNAANAYRVYRNGSLWQILQAVARHRDAGWVKAMAEPIVSAALADSARDFTRGVDWALLVLRTASDPTRRSALDAEIERLRAEIRNLAPARGRGDSWCGYRRSLAAVAEAVRFVLKEDVGALLREAAGVPRGYAGFQVPASLTVAETIAICALPSDADGELHEARTAAQNVQDLVFCARSLSRVNAFVENWWSAALNEVQLAATIDRFVRHPGATEFCAVHIIGERYPDRRLLLPTNALPQWLLGANTLASLAQVYQYPVADVAAVNPGIDVDAVLPADTRVRMPDARWGTMLAAFLASRVMAAPAFTADDRGRLIASLAIPAASNPTALDTVLTRLLIVLRPTLDAELTRLEQIIQKYPSVDGPATAASATGGRGLANTNVTGIRIPPF